MRTHTALLLLCTLVGCASTRTYEVSIKNDTTEPVTIGLVKEGDPFERSWVSPEDAAIAQQEPDSSMWASIPPGKTADTGLISGRFNPSAQAILRIYEGKLNLSGILAISRGQPNRLDIALHPGMNRFTVTQPGTQLEAMPGPDGPAIPTTQP
jgi:hypothetical protein